MAKNDFDIDFDFEEEYGFDPKTFLGDEQYDENIDLSEYSDEELGLQPPVQEEEDFDLTDDDTTEELQDDEELPYDPLEGFPRETAAEEPTFSEEEEEEEPEGEEEEEPQQEPVYEEAEEEEKKKPKKVRPPKKPKPKKVRTGPTLMEKFYDLYFAPLTNKSMLEEPQDPNNPRRRRRKSQAQIFKEVYLPPILVCLCTVLVLSFLIGSVSNAISEYTAEAQRKQGQQKESSEAASMEEQEYDRIMRQVDELVVEYNYQAAYDLLDTFTNTKDYPDVSTKKAELSTTISQLVEHNDISVIPNLSFFPLINDMEKAKKDEQFGGMYNRNFVTTQEFKSILNSLYNKGYVLVDWNNCLDSSLGADGNEMFYTKPILLPEGKKPIMLTETMVNYYRYMISGDEDIFPDANGDSFASKLVVSNGEIKAEYVDGTGTTLVGDYDLVPILETFIKEHPDFVYQGARATLAVTGDEGIFGYRINSSYIHSQSQTFQDEQIVGAKQIVQALRDKGYRIACYTYANKEYKKLSAEQIQQDLTEWTAQITPVLGTVDTFVFAKSSNISDYSEASAVFKMMYQTGFRFFISNGDKPWAEANGSFIRQNRIMVTGNAIAWHPDWFRDMFDCAAVLDTKSRGDVPN